MKEEHKVIVIALFFLTSYIIDLLAGPAVFSVKNPAVFFSQAVYLQYPFTALAIGFKAVGLVTAVAWLLSFLKKLFFVKVLMCFVMMVFAELYALQQTATNVRTTSIQWTLGIAYAGILILIPLLYYLLRGLTLTLYTLLTNDSRKRSTAVKETKSDSLNQSGSEAR